MKQTKPRGNALNPDLQANRYIVEHLVEMQKVKINFSNILKF